MNTAIKIILYGGSLGILFLISQKNYLLFHSLAELFSIIIAFGIFVIGWNSRKYYRNNYLLFIGIAYLFVAFFDTLHTLAYKGMAVFKGYDDNNLPPQLWLVARYMESIALLLAPFFFSRPVRHWRVIAAFSAVSALAIYAIFFAGIFPVCFVTGSGLTTFKVASEYLIDFILCAALYLLYKNREHFEPGVLRLLILSIACTMVTELCFTVYVHLYGISNLVGHFFKIFAFWFMYRAIIETALSKPYDLLFRELRTNEEQFSNAFHFSPNGIALVAPDGRWLKVNNAVCAMVGYTEQELLSKTFQDITHPDDLEVGLDQARMVLDGEIDNFQREKRCIHKGGSIIWVLISVSLVRNDERKPLHFIVHIIDITNRKTIESVLTFISERGWCSWEEEFFPALARFLSETLAMEFICIDRLIGDGNMALTVAVYHNGRFEDNVEYALKDTPCGDVVGKTICCFPRDVARLFPNDPVLKEIKAESYAGITLWGKDEKPIGLIALIGEKPFANQALIETVLQYVAPRAAGELERKIAEQLLLKSESKFRGLFDHIPMSGVIWRLIRDEQNVIVDWEMDEINELGAADIGRSPGELIGKRAVALFGSEVMGSYLELCREVIASNLPKRLETFFAFNNKHYLTVLFAIGTEYYANVSFDITERKQAEEVLRESENRYHALFDLGMDGVVIIDPETGRFNEFNDQVCRQLGYTREEFSLLSVADIELMESPEAVKSHIEKIAATGYDDFETMQRTKQGDARYVHVKAQYSSISGKKVYHCVWRDITRFKKNEQLSAARLHLIEYGLTHSLDELLTESINELENLTGSLIGFYHFVQEDQSTLTLQAWSTRTAREFCRAETAGGHYAIERAGVWADCIRQHEPVVHNDYAALSHRQGMPPGHATVIRELAVPIIRSGNVVGVLGIGNKPGDYSDEDVELVSSFADLTWDIVERKRIQDTLGESNERFAVAFNNAPLMISISTLEDGTYLDVNHCFLDISGFSREEVIGKTSIALGWVSAADRNMLKEAMIRDGRVVAQEFALRTKTGKSLTCSFWGEIIMLAGQKRLLSIAINTTDQRRVEQQLLQAQKMESIGSLAGGVAHDFNNLLTVIMGHVQLGMMKLAANHPACDHLAEIMKSAERSANLTRQLLAFARKQAISPIIIDLNEVIDGMLKMLRRLIGENIHLAWLPAPDLWQIKADPSQIDQILANLCVNARDAIKGTGRISIETRNNTVDANYCAENPEAVPGDYVHLSVSDDGCGMDKETMARVFEPFFTTKPVGEGTGLGLATVYGIVKQNNGFITIYSEPGKGTTLTIHLPRQRSRVKKL